MQLCLRKEMLSTMCWALSDTGYDTWRNKAKANHFRVANWDRWVAQYNDDQQRLIKIMLYLKPLCTVIYMVAQNWTTYPWII